MDATQLPGIAANLGVAGFAMYIMWRMYVASSDRLKEKDEELIREIDKRESRNEKQDEAFRSYVREVQEKTMQQLNRNTDVLDRAIKVLDKHIS